jgi:hypothetical protein
MARSISSIQPHDLCAWSSLIKRDENNTEGRGASEAQAESLMGDVIHSHGFIMILLDALRFLKELTYDSKRRGPMTGAEFFFGWDFAR